MYKITQTQRQTKTISDTNNTINIKNNNRQ